jgi:hypothetical protein
VALHAQNEYPNDPQKGETVKITAFLEKDDEILPGTFDTDNDLIDAAGRMLDKAHLSEAFPRVHFLGDDGKVYVMTLEAVIQEASHELVADLDLPETLDDGNVKSQVQTWLRKKERIHKCISLPCYDIVVELGKPAPERPGEFMGGRIRSSLHEEAGEHTCGEGGDGGFCGCCYDRVVDGIESLILAHACAGIDITAPAYIQGIKTAVEAAGNKD